MNLNICESKYVGGSDMSISVNTHFHPFRLVLGRKEPVELAVEVINRGEEAKMLTLELAISRQLALDRGGLKNGALERMDRLEPNERKNFYYRVYPKQLTQPGEHSVLVNVLEHYNDYKYVQKQNKKKFALTVVE